MRAGACVLIVVLIAGAMGGAALAGGRHEARTDVREAFDKVRALSVENLLGSVEVRPVVDGRAIAVRLRVVAEGATADAAAALGEAVKLVVTRDDRGIHLRVDYPTAHTRFHPPRSEAANVVARWVKPLIDKSTLTVPYGDRMVEVGPGRGAALVFAELRIDVPIDVHVAIDQIWGNVDLHDWRGKAEIEVVDGRIDVERCFGSLQARTTGGSIRVAQFRGDALELHTGTGDVELETIHAERVALHGASGSLVVTDFSAGQTIVRSGTGDVRFDGFEAASLDLASAAGDVEIASRLARAGQMQIAAPDSKVTLRLDAEASFDVHADTRNGAVKTQALDLERIGHEGRSAVLRRGDSGGPELRVVARELVLRSHDAHWIQAVAERDRLH